MKYVNAYPGTLVLPDGEEIASGATVDLSDTQAKNAGVKEWLASKWLVKPGAERAPVEDPSEVKKALNDAMGTLTALTDELERERAKTAALEKDLADAKAALEEAPKPAPKPEEKPKA